ncbi:TPA: pyruvate kinase [Candidatus Woesearchaeota archaeon]|nr:pyruvate kinase [Candidatus Woesearchaeota archaeon]
MRRTKIICTIGPKTETEDMMGKLIAAGMNIARINISHGDPDWHAAIHARLKAVSKDAPFPLGIMVDTQGPEIRTSATEVDLQEGDTLKIAISSACDIQEGEKHTFVNYEQLIHSVKKGDTILVDDGLIALEVLKIGQYHVTCKVLNRGKIGKRKSVNLPGIKTTLPAVTKRDKECITRLAPLGIDFIAQSFVSRREDITEMRSFLRSIACDALIIAKIENQDGIDNIDAIVAEADGIMVARGDLGVEIPLEKIPLAQHMMVGKCIDAGKPVIIATHLLESMVTNPRPTRAEVTDVANAVFQKADVIMLSAETTKGEHPIECVRTMHKIAKSVQAQLKFDYPAAAIRTDDPQEAIALASCINAENLGAKAILVFSQTGKLLSLVAKKRPNIDIFVFTGSEDMRRKLMLHWSTFPFHLEFQPSFNATITAAFSILKRSSLLVKNDKVVIVSDILPKRGIETLEIRSID